MSYVKYIINTTTIACEDICYELTELGITAVEIEDNIPVHDEIQGVDYVELQPNMPVDDGHCKIIYYLDEEDDKLLGEVRRVIDGVGAYCDIGEGTIGVEVIEDEDWQNNWKKYFHAFQVGDLLIQPTWEQNDTPKGVEKCIFIDPGTTFGTGAHETTKLCILGLQKFLKEGDKVLDLGFGSGILSIVALMYKAFHVTGTDIDNECINATKENFKVNNIPYDKGTFYIGDITSDLELQEKVGHNCYDVITANILADIIIGMAPLIYSALKPKGVLISSGIIDFKENEVKSALEQAGLKILEVNHLGEWVNITATKG